MENSFSLLDICLSGFFGFALGVVAMRAFINWLIKKAFPHLED